MTKPVKPIINPTPFNRGDGRDRGESIINAVNDVDPYLSAVIRERQASAAAIPRDQDITQYNLQPGAVVRLGRNGTALITPDEIPAFAEGGYAYRDQMDYANTAAVKARYPNFNSEAMGIAGEQDGFKYIGNSYESSAHFLGATRPFLNLPSVPFHLGIRIRAITNVHNTAVFLESRSGVAYKGRAYMSGGVTGISGNGGGVLFGASTPYGFDDFQESFRERNRLSVNKQDPDVNWFTAILVSETTLAPPVLIDNNWSCVISYKFGYYENIVEAYADTRPGRAFACLDPAHPNYLGENTFPGLWAPVLDRDGRINFDPAEAYTVLGISANRFFYLDVLAGSSHNDINNYAIGDLPEGAQGPINESFTGVDEG